MLGRLVVNQLGNMNQYSSPMQLKNDIEIQKKKLNIFKDIQINCKIGKYDNGDYYIVQPGYLQRFWRYYYDENRDKTWKYLDEDFSDFVKILDRISNHLNTNFTLYIKYAEDIIKTIDSILPGLYNLKQTYKDTSKIVAKVDSIILTLIDFKDDISTIRLKHNKKRPHYERFSKSLEC